MGTKLSQGGETSKSGPRTPGHLWARARRLRRLALFALVASLLVLPITLTPAAAAIPAMGGESHAPGVCVPPPEGGDSCLCGEATLGGVSFAVTSGGYASPLTADSETSTPTTMSSMSTEPIGSSTTVAPMTTKPAGTEVANPREPSVTKVSGVVEAGGGGMAGTSGGLWALVALALVLALGLVFSSRKASVGKGGRRS